MHENKTPQQVFHEIDQHLYDLQPSQYFNEIKGHYYFVEYPFSLLAQMEYVPQSPQFHPEGNVWNHTMLVIDEAARQKHKSKNERVFLWAALLHDIGKKDTTRKKNGRITAYDHDKLGAELTEQFLKELTDDPLFVRNVTSLVRWHMQILFVAKSMRFADIESMRGEIDIREVALLGYCDRMGRLGANQLEEEENVTLFLQRCGLPPIHF